MHPEDFIKLQPYAYHLTARANLPAIERTRRLDPASSIFARGNGQDLLAAQPAQKAIRFEVEIFVHASPSHPAKAVERGAGTVLRDMR